MSQRVKIANKMIGENESCFIVAETGSNHDQKLSQAKQLIDIAAGSKVNAVKFQSYRAEQMVARTKKRIENGKFDDLKTFYELYKKTELPWEWLEKLKNYAESKNIIFLCSPFDEEAVDKLDALSIPAFKIASAELSHLSLLEYIAQKKKPIILSTAMATLGEIERAIEIILKQGNNQIILMHCAMGYPLKTENANLAVMDTLSQVFSFPVGYSDHTLGVSVSIAAVARGARVIEKHFTISKDLSGPDHSFALEPSELNALVREVRIVEKAIGSSQKKIFDSELIYYLRGRRSIFAKINIPKGTVIKKKMLAILHPGIGIEPEYSNMVVGRKTKTDIKNQEPITWDKI